MAQAANPSLFQRLIRVLLWLIEQAYPIAQLRIGDIKFMYIVKDDNPDVAFAVQVGDVTDAEGNVIADAQIDVVVESDNEDAVKVSAADDGRSGTISFGSPGVATVNVTASDANGDVLASGAASFTVTTGDPAAIAALNISFDGLTEAQ